MKVVNNKKAQAKTYIRNDLNSNVTNINNEISELEDTIAILWNLVGGSIREVDQELIGYCKQARESMAQAIKTTHAVIQLSNQLDVMEEIPDNEY